MNVRALAVAALAALFLSACACGGRQPLPGEVVENVDLGRYMGLWYEIASLPNRFQQGCSCTTASYSLDKGQVRVVNRCKREGRFDQARGIARAVAGSGNARLEVSFFRPFWGDYWIIALDEDYQWAMVGHPQRKYLWILARKPRLDPAVMEILRQKAAEQGYDIGRLVLTDQQCPAQDR